MIGWFEKRRTASIFMLMLIAIEIFYFSSLSSSGGAGGNIWIPRIYHFAVFFLFAFFLFAVIKKDKKIKAKYIVIVVIISIVYAVLDEFHQTFVPGRDASIRDILTDTLGIFLLIAIYSYSIKKAGKTK